MANYTLKALIDNETVKKFNMLNQRVIIVKEAEGSGADVAWVTFAPFEINSVSWEEAYGVYASCSEMEGKAKIEKSSYAQASEKQSYAFANGIFEPPVTDTTLGDNMYEIKNNMTDPDILTFGLAQDVVANGVTYEGNPINAVQVLSNESATFTPHERISIFMQSDLDDGMVISRIKSQALLLDFAKQADIVIKYDPAVGGFVKA
ncbi:hypothetical protein [Azotosporobacter soli]|uniref:hypothetical protein n=1 Tax=Azotosporobacter soli TaxID=3055040 RepID=UPI0031FF168F